MENKLVKISKYLSYVLRHKPEAIGLALDPEGWALLDELVEKASQNLSLALIREVVATNDKQRFSISDDGLYIRANQGHSIEVDLGLAPVVPPDVLWHGTATRFLEAILKEGLRPKSRRYVHLSADEVTARTVGQRHGKPVVLTVAAGALHDGGHEFFQAANGVWLSRHIPVGAIAVSTD